MSVHLHLFNVKKKKIIIIEVKPPESKIQYINSHSGQPLSFEIVVIQ